MQVEIIKRRTELNNEPLWVAQNSVIKDNLFILSDEKEIIKINIVDFKISKLLKLSNTQINFGKSVIIKISPTEKFCVIANQYGQFGVVIDLETKEVVLELTRDEYCVEHCSFSLEFFQRDSQEYLIHNTDWNRLDITNLNSKKLCTERKSPEHKEPHYLDYFHSEILISPNYDWIVDNGWVWHPFGVLTAWSLAEWLQNPWESEDGNSKFEITSAAYLWDRPLCWIDKNTLAYWGVGEDDEEMEDSAVIYDVVKRKEIKIIKGVTKGKLLFDKYLYCSSLQNGLSIWNIETSALMYSNEKIKPDTFIQSQNGIIIGVSENHIEFLKIIS